MRRAIARTSIALALLVVTAAAQNINLGNLLKSLPVQQLPVNAGLAAHGAYLLEAKGLHYGLLAELLFPVTGPLRCRATLLTLTLRPDRKTAIELNPTASLDALFTFAGRRARIWPYVFLGGGLTTLNSNFEYSLHGGLAVEGRVQKNLSAFGEVGFEHSYASEAGANRIIGRAGVRIGS